MQKKSWNGIKKLNNDKILNLLNNKNYSIEKHVEIKVFKDL